MSENGEAHNETPSESDKMDISEVSDQVSPVSDQSEVVDNQRPAGAARPLRLDNASATSTTKTTTMTSTTGSTGATRGRLSSTLSLEGLDLELPSLDMYQEEYAEFPSSPKHLKERLEAHGLSMPLERDSGTTDSINDGTYVPIGEKGIGKAASSNSINEEIVVRIEEKHIGKVASSEGVKDETRGMSEDERLKSRRVLTPNPEDALLPNLYGATGDVPIVLESSFENSTLERVKNRKNNSKTQTNEDAGLVLGNKLKVSCTGDNMNEDRNKRNTLLDIPVVALQDKEEESSFVFERRDSKRLTRKELGERIMEGLFVESRRKDHAASSGLRKIPVPKDLELMNSPTIEYRNPPTFKADGNLDEKPINPQQTSENLNGKTKVSSLENGTGSNPNSLVSDSSRTTSNGFGTHLNETEDSFVKPRPATRKVHPCVPLDRSTITTPVPAARTRSLASVSDDSRSLVPLTSPPCPKPRRKYRGPSDHETSRGPILLLDPAALESRAPRAVPKINPDGSVELQPERPGSLVASQRGGRRKIQVSADILKGPAEEDNVSSGDSRLSDTDMMSPDDDPDLDALLSPDLDTPDELEDSILERLGEPPPEPDPIPELSAAEERAEARSWRNCIVAGLERRIDMKVIEPYKRVLSHGGYLAAGSHNAIIVFSACFLPDHSRVDYDYVMDNLFLYVLTTLDQLITEDYVLIYLHGATARSCMPTFSWLKRCYQMIDRRLRKNLKGLYLVHPTFWLKTIVLMTRPFISTKFSRKLRFIESLSELAAVVPLEQASIPDRVKQLDLDEQAHSLKHRILPWWSSRSTPDTTATI